MDRRRSSLLLTFIFVLSSLGTPFLDGLTQDSSEHTFTEQAALSELFAGFSSEDEADFWNQTAW